MPSIGMYSSAKETNNLILQAKIDADLRNGKVQADLTSFASRIGISVTWIDCSQQELNDDDKWDGMEQLYRGIYPSEVFRWLSI